uniref:Adenylate kinase isoenzyme 6 homolog n=1 Tax=Leptocylindrus danicus TaxID=163516 RepID=A0A7S2LK93_9STRA|mmetsp:Transcript_6254/g.9188  ORF Transcript_6254/g.9188 Transcript_6254/m.9188 type:complete len:193 (+) Transcript_6254:269-847(+)
MNEGKKGRTRPNILITGTPGVGKTATASLIAEKLNMKYISVGDLVKKHACHEGMDTEFDSYILDEDKLLDLMEPMMSGEDESDDDEEITEGIVTDFHSCDFFPERWFDLVLVLRANTEVLFDRLAERGYSEKKRNENLECEIMQIVLDEARESYAEEIVHEVPSNTLEDMESNVSRVQQWFDHWVKSNDEES